MCRCSCPTCTDSTTCQPAHQPAGSTFLHTTFQYSVVNNQDTQAFQLRPEVTSSPFKNMATFLQAKCTSLSPNQRHHSNKTKQSHNQSSDHESNKCNRRCTSIRVYSGPCTEQITTINRHILSHNRWDFAASPQQNEQNESVCRGRQSHVLSENVGRSLYGQDRRDIARDWCVCEEDIQTKLYSPDVANMPPTMPHRRTRNCQNGWWLSRMWTRNDDRSYFTKIPGTPWLPFEWLIVRFLTTTTTNISI